MTTREIVLFGASGNTMSIIDAIVEINRSPAAEVRYTIKGILDDIPDNLGRAVLGVPVLAPIERARDFDGCVFINGISSPASYLKKPELITRAGIPRDRFVSIYHPSAVVSQFARVGLGTAVLANSVICAAAEVGDHVIVLQNSVINHQATVGHYTTVSSNVTILGQVDIGPCAFIGGAASIAPGVRVGEGALVGMGAVATRDVEANSVVVGVPTRLLRRADAER